jgi:hypothetical protein
MMRRCVLGVGIALLVAGSVTFGQSQRRTQKFSVQGSYTNFLVGQCDGFEIWSDWVELLTWVDRVDKNGQFAQEVGREKLLGQSLYYNSTNFDKAVAGGPGEAANFRWDAKTGRVYNSAVSWKVTVPGYGIIFAETGATVYQCDPYTFENCQLVSNTGHNQFIDEDLAALCDYLK